MIAPSYSFEINKSEAQSERKRSSKLWKGEESTHQERAKVTLISIYESESAFNLVELVTTLAIVSVLTSFALPSLIETAKILQEKAQMYTIKNAIIKAKAQTIYLGQITGSSWSAGSCQGAAASSAGCRDRMDLTMRALGFEGSRKNPWGNYYAIDENESPGPSCFRDSVQSTRENGELIVMWVPLTILPETSPGRCD